MIIINDDWLVDVDDYNYTLKRDTHRIVQRKQRDGSVTSDKVYTTKGHFSSLDKALERLGSEMIRDKLKDADIDLNTAVNTIRECRNEWNQITEKILENNKC